MMELEIGPYWARIVEHYYLIECDRGANIWQWLEKEYGAHVTWDRDALFNSDKLRFPRKEDAVLFKLRWL